MLRSVAFKYSSVLALSLLPAIFGAGTAAAKSETVKTDLGYPEGSIVIVNTERRLYYVTGKGQAIRYPIAVGKSEELWMGRTFVSSKHVDPRWIPVDGSEPVEGGDPSNPLGKRALYLDWSLLRIHGTPSRGSIGAAVSNGCIRMLNEDVLDLYERVHIGAPVFAIRTAKDAGSYRTAKVGERDYANPEARQLAQQSKSWSYYEDEDDRDERLERQRDRRYIQRYGYGYRQPSWSRPSYGRSPWWW